MSNFIAVQPEGFDVTLAFTCIFFTNKTSKKIKIKIKKKNKINKRQRQNNSINNKKSSNFSNRKFIILEKFFVQERTDLQCDVWKSRNQKIITLSFFFPQKDV